MRKKNIADKRRARLREQLWPGSLELIWDPTDTEKVVGFATIPRMLPLAMTLIKHLAAGAKTGDPSPVLWELWSRDYGQGLVSVTDEGENAYAAGYASTRAIRTWREHMLKLIDLGFIRAKPDGNREFGQVLLLNPLA